MLHRYNRFIQKKNLNKRTKLKKIYNEVTFVELIIDTYIYNC